MSGIALVEPGSAAAEDIVRRVVRRFPTGTQLESAIRFAIELAWAAALCRPDGGQTAPESGMP